MNRDKKCEERIGPALESTMAQIREALGWDRDEDEDEDETRYVVRQTGDRWEVVDTRTDDMVISSYDDEDAAVEHAEDCEEESREAGKDDEDTRTAEEKREEFEESILCVDKRLTYRITLSTGGPADGFNLEVDPETHEIISAEYWYQDWFDGATRPITGDDLKAVEAIFGYLVSD